MTGSGAQPTNDFSGSSHRTFYPDAAYRVWPIKDYVRQMVFGRGLHGQEQGADKGVEASADILDIEDEDVDALEHIGCRLGLQAEERKDLSSCCRIDFVLDNTSIRGIAANTVLGSKKGFNPHAFLPGQGVGQVSPVRQKGGVVGDQTDSSGTDEIQLFLNEQVGSRQDLLC